MPSTPHSDGFKELIQCARRGDRDAMDAAIARMRPHLEGIVQAHSDSEEDASDLLKKASRMAWRRRRRIPAGDDDGETFTRFRGWLGSILHRLGRRRRMSACIDGLEDPLARAVIRLRFLQGLSLEGIARRLDRDMDAIRSEYRTAMQELEHLYYLGPDPPPREKTDPAVDDRVQKVAEIYWEALHAGNEPDLEAIVQQYPDLGDHLRTRLELVRKMHENRPPRGTAPPPETDRVPPGFRSILSAVKGGDEEAREALHRILLPEIERLSTGRSTPDRYLVDEDELSMKVSRHVREAVVSLPVGETDEEAFTLFRIWLRDIVRKVAGHLERRHAHRPWANAGVRTVSERIRDALARIPDRGDASILWMHLFDGASLDEVAKRLGEDYRRVRERYRRAVQVLQEELEPILRG